MLSYQILEIIIFLGAAYAMFKAGSAYTIWRIQRDLIALENGELELDDDDYEDPTANAEFMNIVKEDGSFYAYGHQNRFLTQSDSLKGLFTNIKEIYPDTVWLIGEKHDTLSKEEIENITPILKSIFNSDGEKTDE